jgi:hypothetical protein
MLRRTGFSNYYFFFSFSNDDTIQIIVEALRQIPNAYGVPPYIAQLAEQAAISMDRFPVADSADALDASPNESVTDTSGMGFEFGGSDSSTGSFDNNFEGDENIEEIEPDFDLSFSDNNSLEDREDVLETIEELLFGKDKKETNEDEIDINEILDLNDI